MELKERGKGQREWEGGTEDDEVGKNDRERERGEVAVILKYDVFVLTAYS